MQRLEMKKIMRILLYTGLLCLVATNLMAQNKTRIAVLSFEAKNVADATAEAVADILSTELFNTNRFDVIERQAINRILEEQQLQMTGVTDMSQAAEIGKVLNVEKIMIGSVSRLGQTYIINTRLVDVETGTTELAENTKSNNGEDGLPAAIQELVGVIAQKVVVEGKVIKVTPNTILIDLGTIHGIKKDQVLEVIRFGDVITDLSGSAVGRAEDKIGLLKVVKVNKEYCETQVLQSKTNVQLGDNVRLTTNKFNLPVETPVVKKDKPQPQPRKQRPKKGDNKTKPVDLPPVF